MRVDEPAAGGAVTLRDGTRVAVRPIRPEDEPLMAAFHAGLSTRSVYQRYFYLPSLEQRIAHARLALSCRVDPAVGIALVAERRRDDGEPEVLALARLTRTPPEGSAEFALLVMDGWQGLGLGHALLQHLIAAARTLGIRRLYGDMMADNDAMRAVVRHAGFVIRTVPGDGAVLRAERAI
jgi:acetyltransferase